MFPPGNPNTGVYCHEANKVRFGDIDIFTFNKIKVTNKCVKISFLPNAHNEELVVKLKDAVRSFTIAKLNIEVDLFSDGKRVSCLDVSGVHCIESWEYVLEENGVEIVFTFKSSRLRA